MKTAAIGRQMQRSGHNHQRHNSSEKLLFEQTLPSSGLNVSQQRGVSGEFLRSLEPLTPPLSSRSSGQRENRADVSLIEMSPGILDLHSYDTELLSDIRAPGFYDDLEPSYCGNNQMGKAWLNDHSKSFDKEKQSSVAKIKVVVRKRPLNKKERAKKEEDIVTIEQSTNSLTVHETKLKVDLKEYVEKHEFVFDAVLDEDVSNNELYCQTVEPIIPAIFQRTKATCIAYGQTGSGKTYTMQPLPLRASEHILNLMNHAYRNQGFQLFVSFFEIYGGKVFDLLSDRRKLCMREDGKQQVCIVGLQEFLVSSVEAIRELIDKGNASRSTGTTGANEESSRSHAILQLAIKKLPAGIEKKSPRAISKLSFIDLAGSERGADTTDNDKQTRIEGAEINRSLLALKECIRALDSDQNHIPFRGSKLTEVLRDSFMGNSRTVMISCISPSSGSCEHTLNTLRYADRVKSLSKVSNPKKELSSSSNLRESTATLSSSLPNLSEPQNGNIEFTTGTHRMGWTKQIQQVAPSHFNAHNVPTGKKDAYLQDNISWRKSESYSAPSSDEKKQRAPAQLRKMGDSIDVDNNLLNSDDYLINILKEEEDLIIAHRRHVEKMMDIVREEMKLLGETDRPGRQLDSSYTSRLDALLSQKAVGIGHLQESLENFQKILMKNKILVPSFTQ